MGCEDKKQQERAKQNHALLAEAPAPKETLTSEGFQEFFKRRLSLLKEASCEAISSVGSQPQDVGSQPAGVLLPAVASVEGEEDKTEAAKTKEILPHDESDLFAAPPCLREHSTTLPQSAFRLSTQERREEMLAAAQQGAAAQAKVERDFAQPSPQEYLTGTLRYVTVSEWQWTPAQGPPGPWHTQRNPQAQPKRETGHAQDHKEKHTENERGHGEMEKKAAKDQGLFLYYTIQHHTITYSTFIWHCIV